MTLTDVIKLLGAAAVLALVVTLITPSTKPVAAAAGDWRKQIPVKTGMAPPASSTGIVPADALSRRPPPAPPAAEQLPSDDVVEQPSDAVAASDRGVRLSDDIGERRFRQGYRWAESNDVDDERDCYRDPGDPFTDGCIAWLRDSDDDRAGGSPSCDGRHDAPDGWGR